MQRNPVGVTLQVRFIAVLSEPAEPEPQLPSAAEPAGATGQDASGSLQAAGAASSGNGDSAMEEALPTENEHDVAAASGADTPTAADEAAQAETPGKEATGSESPADASASEAPATPADAGPGAAVQDAAAPAEAEPAKAAAAAAAPAAAAETAPAASDKPPAALGRRRLTLVLRYVVNPASLLPLYSVTVDMDLHPHLGQPLKVRVSEMKSITRRFFSLIHRSSCAAAVLGHGRHGPAPPPGPALGASVKAKLLTLKLHFPRRKCTQHMRRT